MTITKSPTNRAPGRTTGLKVGDLVEVRSAEEILATLDEHGELENLPFMPEMLAFCGQRLTVHKIAHKLCDSLSWSGMHAMPRAVHLTGARCDGSAHGGCQTACTLYWKEEWLRRVEPDEPPPPLPSGSLTPAADGRRFLPILEVNARREPGPDGEPRYACQATEILRAAPDLVRLSDVSQYVKDVSTGNASPPFVARSVFVSLFNRFQSFSRRRLPERLRIRRGLRWGFLEGGSGNPTPTAVLDLQPGEVVRIKSKDEIGATLNQDLLNRGMGFDVEMARFCGRTAVVKSRVNQCIDERTGRMLTMKTPCIVLEGIVCEGAYNVACPREFIPFWREIWLERV
jgi:hypothetical protein